MPISLSLAHQHTVQNLPVYASFITDENRHSCPYRKTIQLQQHDGLEIPLKQAPLIRLPPELRLIIYDHCSALTLLHLSLTCTTLLLELNTLPTILTTSYGYATPTNNCPACTRSTPSPTPPPPRPTASTGIRITRVSYGQPPPRPHHTGSTTRISHTTIITRPSTPDPIILPLILTLHHISKLQTPLEVLHYAKIYIGERASQLPMDPTNSDPSHSRAEFSPVRGSSSGMANVVCLSCIRASHDVCLDREGNMVFDEDKVLVPAAQKTGCACRSRIAERVEFREAPVRQRKLEVEPLMRTGICGEGGVAAGRRGGGYDKARRVHFFGSGRGVDWDVLFESCEKCFGSCDVKSNEKLLTFCPRYFVLTL
ncbi:hypothetical protein BJ508DRAFT_303907 [Ascobolus immersus RN42]|uniref:F-box domain-containing protein n=1 Tax=Ascobolus immersus RN42 TaxID=1160509 RepID=A0A3N4IE83_ASCIM|nr:hypothetical protein BJ508DRAFT_303907 [Ascobolus immersus RN42]